MEDLKNNQSGSGAVIGLVIFIFLFLAASGFGVWAFMGQQHYKNNVDSIVSKNVDSAVTAQQGKDSLALAQALKYPLQSYSGPSQYGSLKLLFPKTYSAYIDESGSGGDLIDGYFHPNFVPTINGASSVFALKIQISNQTYSTYLQSFQGQIKSGKISASAYSLTKVPNVVGTELKGSVFQGNSAGGTMILLPERSSTIIISTIGNDYLNDFNNIILPNLSFSP